MRRVVPKWILELPSGSYYMSDLFTITGLKVRQSIHKVLLKHGGHIIRDKGSNRNVYVWSGYNEKKIKTMLVDEGNKTFRYELVLTTEELSPQLELIATSDGWMKKVCEVNKTPKERNAG